MAKAFGLPYEAMYEYMGHRDLAGRELPSRYAGNNYHPTEGEYNLSLFRWAEEHRPGIEKVARRLAFLADARRRAAEGDPDAILAVPEGRQAIRALVTGTKNRHTPKISGLTSARGAIREAKRRIEEREARKGDDPEPARPNRVREMWLARLRTRAVGMAEEYHRTERPLYASGRADVVYGRGGQEGRDDEAYSLAYRSRYGGARWRNAGARLDSEDDPRFVIVENHLGREVVRLPLDRPEPEEVYRPAAPRKS